MAHPASSNTLLEAGDVARALHCSVARVRQLADAGHLPVAARTPRGSRLFRADQVADLIATRQTRSHSED
jgi:DNA-binding transcriptional MerR regulator